MKNIILFSVICFAHILLATNKLIPLFISIPLAIVVIFMFYKKFHFDWSYLIQIVFIAIYIINGPKWENLIVLLCGVLVFMYSFSLHKKLEQYKTSKIEMNTQLEQFNETFQTVRKERHDYLKHIAAISYMLEKEDYETAKDYMRKIVERFEETSLSIKGEQGAVASVLHTNYKVAKNKGIAINYHLEVPVSSLPIPVDEIVELVGNILENAIDACEEWQKVNKEQGVIELSLRKRSGLYILTCENNTIPLSPSIADQLFTTSGLTTKEHHTGLGTTIIKQIIEKHNGFLDFVTEKNTFLITCKIPSVL